MKPLFCPLKTQYFNQFKNGEKNTEYRAYGKRWNENTCAIGRIITLSHGYSGERLHGKITDFQIKNISNTNEDVMSLYRNKTELIACITIELHI